MRQIIKILRFYKETKLLQVDFEYANHHTTLRRQNDGQASVNQYRKL